MKQLSCCGTDCSVCGFYGKQCKGCHESGGKVFYKEGGETCEIYRCVVQEKNLGDCLSCDKLPCPIWKDTRDPVMSDEEFEDNIRERIENLKGNRG